MAKNLEFPFNECQISHTDEFAIKNSTYCAWMFSEYTELLSCFDPKNGIELSIEFSQLFTSLLWYLNDMNWFFSLNCWNLWDHKSLNWTWLPVATILNYDQHQYQLCFFFCHEELAVVQLGWWQRIREECWFFRNTCSFAYMIKFFNFSQKKVPI